MAAADLAEPVNQASDFGCGADHEIADLLRSYGQHHGLCRWVFALPLTMPMDRLSGAWIGLVTPVPSKLAVPLAQSMAEDAASPRSSRTRPAG